MCDNCSDNCTVNVSDEDKDKVRRYYTCPSWEVQTRQYLQFGDLVFDGKRTVEAYSTTFKSNIVSYLGQAGGFDTTCQVLPESTTLSLTIEFAFVKMSNLQKQEYSNYIKRNLLGVNRLWAVDTGGQLIWTWAKVITASENIDAPYSTKSMAVEFSLPTGTWYIADLSKVYVEEYERCIFQPELGCGCTSMCLDDPFAGCAGRGDECSENCCECSELVSELTDDKLFCNTDTDLYWDCQAEFKLIYNCQSIDPCNIFRNFGMAITQNLCNAITGTFCSNTVLDGDVIVTLVGAYHNPAVRINDQEISIKGDYQGIIQIMADGKVRYFPNADSGTFHGSSVIKLDNICYNCNIAKFDVKPCTNTIQVRGAEGNWAQAVFLDLMEKTY